MSKISGLKNAKVYISVTAADGATPEAQNSDLTQGGFEALEWQEIGNVGEIGEYGTVQDFATYHTLSKPIAEKIKTTANAGDPTVECREDVTDRGQIAAKAAGKSTFTDAVAFKFEMDDMPSGGANNTTRYSRGKVGGPIYPNGRIEAFQLARFIFALEQEIIEVVAS